MNPMTNWLSLTALALLGAAPLQQQGLRPAEAPMQASDDGAPLALDAGEVARALRSADLGERRRAYEATLEAARRDPVIRERVEAWAADAAGDTELAWTAQLLLRELEAAPPRLPSPFGHGVDPFHPRWMRELLERDPFEGLDLPGWPGGALPPGATAPLAPGASSQGQTLRMQTGPDGVRVEVEETRDGRTEAKVYEAESLEALLEAHPELRGRIGGGSDPLRLPEVRMPSLEDLLDGVGLAPPGGLRPVVPSLARLGIRMLEPAMRTTVFEGVPANEGLEVVEVVPGSLAAAVGVVPGELVRSLGGETIRSASDVRRILAGLSLDRRIEVECVQPDGSVRVRSWEPVEAEPSSGDAAESAPL